MNSLSLLVTPAHTCSYLSHQQSKSAFIHPQHPLTTALYSTLITHGFRRSGDEVYRPHCADCSACISCRIPVEDFKPSRSQKRCLNKNTHTQVKIQTARFKLEHYELYLRYQQYKHPNSSMASLSVEDYLNFLSSTWCHTQFIEFYINQHLAAVAVIDFLNQSLSAVYTFFAPELAKYSLGTYAILWQIKQAQQLGLDYVYLGFWIATCQKMTYKTQYQPLQGLRHHSWQLIK